MMIVLFLGHEVSHSNSCKLGKHWLTGDLGCTSIASRPIPRGGAGADLLRIGA